MLLATLIRAFPCACRRRGVSNLLATLAPEGERGNLRVYNPNYYSPYPEPENSNPILKCWFLNQKQFWDGADDLI